MEYNFYIVTDFLSCKLCCGKLTFKINQCKWNHFFNLSLFCLRWTVACPCPIWGEQMLAILQDKFTLYLLWPDPVPSQAIFKLSRWPTSLFAGFSAAHLRVSLYWACLSLKAHFCNSSSHTRSFRASDRLYSLVHIMFTCTFSSCRTLFWKRFPIPDGLLMPNYKAKTEYRFIDIYILFNEKHLYAKRKHRQFQYF